jgi:hypothetical protein
MPDVEAIMIKHLVKDLHNRLLNRPSTQVHPITQSTIHSEAW